MKLIQLDETDTFLESIGIDTTPLSPEDLFMDDFTSGTYTKVDNLRYYLLHELAKFTFLLEENVKITRYTYVINQDKAFDQQLSILDYSKLHIKYYLQMYHLPRFTTEFAGKKVCDITATVEMIVKLPRIKELIDKVTHEKT